VPPWNPENRSVVCVALELVTRIAFSVRGGNQYPVNISLKPIYRCLRVFRVMLSRNLLEFMGDSYAISLPLSKPFRQLDPGLAIWAGDGRVRHGIHSVVVINGVI
jgi:hypothetical protein